MFEVEINKTIYRVTDEQIEVTPGNMKDKMQVKMGVAKEIIPLSNLAAIGVSPGTLMVGGHIQFAEFEDDGTYFVANKFSEALDPRCKNWFHLSKPGNEKAIQLKEYVENWLRENGTGPISRSAGKVDTDTQLKALKDLLNAGLISQEDFDKQSKGFN